MSPQTDERLRLIVDRAEIAGLLDRYVTGLDRVGREQRTDNWYRSLFTDDVSLTFPIGGRDGVVGLALFQSEATQRWEHTHHINGSAVVEVDGDRATVRAHVLAVHKRAGDGIDALFAVGGHYEGEAVWTASGWRLRRLAFQIDWSAGRPPVLS